MLVSTCASRSDNENTCLELHGIVDIVCRPAPNCIDRVSTELKHIPTLVRLTSVSASGFQWAADHEKTQYIMNLDSDMLLVEDYFERVTDDLDTTRLVCDSPIVSGYASKRWGKAFGCVYIVLSVLLFTGMYLHTQVQPYVHNGIRITCPCPCIRSYQVDRVAHSY